MAGHATREVHLALQEFADSLHAKLGIPGAPAAWPEDQLKGPVETLFKRIGGNLGVVVVVRSEAPRPANQEEGEDGGSRVDAAVSTGSTVRSTVLTGHIELKAPSKSGDPKRLTSKADKAQWKKFQKLPNLIYTNGREWTLQRTGQQVGQMVSFTADPVTRGAASVTIEDAARFEGLVESFLTWAPIVPRTSKHIAELLAPLCRLLRTEVLDALRREDSAMNKLAREVRKYLFPNASDEVVADAYAQAFTYALLIARFEGAEPFTLSKAEQVLQSGHGLMSEVLHLLDTSAARSEVETSTDTILRVIAEVKPSAIVAKHGDNPWIYFYEEFLAAYDPELRKKVGAYYTPIGVVHAQVAFVRELLIERFGKKSAFADHGVVSLDPAVGTGTYPLGILKSVADAVPEYAAGSVPELLRRALDNLYGIEYLVGPYSVAHLRLSRFLADNNVKLSSEHPLKILLADTLASHEDDAAAMLPEVFGYEEILQEREVARELKADTRVVVCVGNPPYLRSKKAEGGEAIGGWVTMRRERKKGQKWRDPLSGRMVADKGERGIIKDFIDPALDSGHGGDLKNLYNAYVYFWRWALWKVFEQELTTTEEGDIPPKSGIVSFITAASFLRGPGFVGMRQHMRMLLDEIWILDLGGDNKGGRRSENVFSIETPVAITTGIRYAEPHPDMPAVVHYVSLADLSREEKLRRLSELTGLNDSSLTWQDAMPGWQDPFLPATDSNYFSWPALMDIFPWQSSGVQLKRSWPIGETRKVLEDRWGELTSGLPVDLLSENGTENLQLRTKRRAQLFKETGDRKIDKTYPGLLTGDRLPALATLESGDPPTIRTYAFRSFDQQFVIADNRVGDRMRPSIWAAHSGEQRYLVSMLTEVMSHGPAAVIARDVPDLHHFRGSFGGRHVIPLWRDANATMPNVTAGLLGLLTRCYGFDVSVKDVFSYCYALMSNPSYVEHFWDPLTIPGPHIPVTKNAILFARVRDHGTELVELHGDALFHMDVLTAENPGFARYSKRISADEYPDHFSYDAKTRTLSIGDGEFSDVAPEVWEYSVSGLRIVESWLNYRKKKRFGKSGSRLDEIRPTEWPDLNGEKLLRLLWVLEKTVASEPLGESLLEEVLCSRLLKSTDLPKPSSEERKPHLGTDDDDECDDQDEGDERGT